MNYKGISALFLFIILSISVNAAICNITGLPVKFALENARPYNGIGEPITFYAHYQDANGVALTTNNTLVNVSFNGTTYNMTYNAIFKRWAITVTSNITEDVVFTVMGMNDIYQCRQISFTSKWRTPFNVQFQLYKKPPNSTEPERYTNDFQYVVLVDNAYKNKNDLALYAWDTGMNKAVNAAFGWLSDAPLQKTVTPDRNTYFWGKYSGGTATVKLYTGGNYSVYVMNNKVEMPSNFFYEFERPTTQDISYMGIVYEDLPIYNLTNVSNTPSSFNNTIFKISFSRFEANTYYAVMNWFQIVIVAVCYFGLLSLLLWATRGAGDQAAIIGWYLVIATPIALGFVVYIQ